MVYALHRHKPIYQRFPSHATPATTRGSKACIIPYEFNTLRPRQNGRHFPDDILKCIFLNENEWISIKISLKPVPKCQINNIPSLFQIMAWRRPGNILWLKLWKQSLHISNMILNIKPYPLVSSVYVLNFSGQDLQIKYIQELHTKQTPGGRSIARDSYLYSGFHHGNKSVSHRLINIIHILLPGRAAFVS